MKKKEIEVFFKWFMAIIPERIKMLTQAVQATPSYESWKPDYSPDSLSVLGEWFAANIQTRRRTMEEKDEIYQDAPGWFRQVDIRNEELNNRTLSLAIDVGIYLSQVFLKNNPSISWHLYNGSKKDINHGQPVLKGFGDKSLNPTHLMITLAYGLADGSHNSSRLRELYNIWNTFVQ
jgi:hypothetical protein